jgi:hypothetical protein
MVNIEFFRRSGDSLLILFSEDSPFETPCEALYPSEELPYTKPCAGRLGRAEKKLASFYRVLYKDSSERPLTDVF